MYIKYIIIYNTNLYEYTIAHVFTVSLAVFSFVFYFSMLWFVYRQITEVAKFFICLKCATGISVPFIHMYLLTYIYKHACMQIFLYHIYVNIGIYDDAYIYI